MGRLNIPVMCHNWMAGIGWTRTHFALPERGGALVSGYDHETYEALGPTEFGTVTEEQIWERMDYFLQRVVPVAEKAGVYPGRPSGRPAAITGSRHRADPDLA